MIPKAVILKNPVQKNERVRAMKALRFIALVMIMSLLGGFQPARAENYPQVVAQTAILLDANTGITLFSKNPDQVMYPASTTKIMTLLLALENGDLDETITIGQEVNMIAWDSSRANLRPGDRISLRDLLYGLMLASGNDAAYSVAVHIARNISENPNLPAATGLRDFAALMNQRAKEMGATNTNFVNPDGYPHPSHYTTARDLALITAAAMKNPDYREFDSTAHYHPETWAGGNVQSWNNGNFLIRRDREFYYDRAVGGKTGFTYPAGFTMVATAAHDEMELVAVALKTSADGRWHDTTGLLEFGFQEYTSQQLLTSGEIITTVNIAGTNQSRTLYALEDTFGSFQAENGKEPDADVVLLPDLIDSEVPMTLKTVPEPGMTVGELVFTIDGNEIGRAALAAKENGFIPWLKRFFLRLTNIQDTL